MKESLKNLECIAGNEYYINKEIEKGKNQADRIAKKLLNSAYTLMLYSLFPRIMDNPNKAELLKSYISISLNMIPMQNFQELSINFLKRFYDHLKNLKK
ncbi:MAG: hypothetical protein QXJ28_02840 [Candidatus Pacearchaeota archaeon]